MSKRKISSSIKKFASTSNTELGSDVSPEVLVGLKVREIRNRKGLSLRELAKRSKLNINTLSMLENGKSSPSVSTLHQLAISLEVPLSAFFEPQASFKQVVFTPQLQRPEVLFDQMRLEVLGKGVKHNVIQPFVVTLAPQSDSGDNLIVHTGFELVYCLSGTINYSIGENVYTLAEGDSLVFESHLPHKWQNLSGEHAKMLLVLFPYEQRENLGSLHFPSLH
jgi:transcriptional regulator with XRE-family HTH domain